MIDVRDFTKQYDDLTAVDRLTFRAEPGQVLGLVGPNGAGKTTTLRALCGVVSPTAGHVSVAGFDVTREPVEVKSRLAYVPDDPPLFSDMTVDEHLAFTAAAYGVRNAAVRAEELLDRFQLLSKRAERAGNLSRGMRQKLAVCCAYLHDPEVLLFDEPLTGLDPAGIRLLLDSLRVRAAEGATVIVSSHLLAMIEEICTDVLILDHGRSRFRGSLEELRSRFLDRNEAATLERVFFEATRDEATPAPEVSAVAEVF